MATQLESGTELRAWIEGAVKDHHAMVHRIAYAVTQHAADAEDVAQATFLALVRSAAQPPAQDVLRAWLARVAINAGRKSLRGRRNRRGFETEWVKRRNSERKGGGMTTDDRDELRHAIEQLPEELRLPVVLHYQEGLKHDEIASTLDCPAGTVARRIHTAKQRLRETLTSANAAVLAAPSGLDNLLDSVSAWPPTPPALERRIVERVAMEIASFGGFAGLGSAMSSGTSATVLGATRASVSAVRSSRIWPLSAVGLLAAVGVGIFVFSGAPDETVRIAGGVRSVLASAPATVDAMAPTTPPTAPEPSPSAAPELKAQIYGFARDEAGQPVPGVSVFLKESPSGELRATTITDANGYYEFLRVPEQPDSLAAHLKESDSAKLTPDDIVRAIMRRDAARRAAAKAEPSAPKNSEAEATVAEPIAAVDWTQAPQPFRGQTMSMSPDGFEIEMRLEHYQIAQHHAGHVAAETRREVSLTLQPAMALRGRVVDANGQPIAGAEILVVGALFSGAVEAPRLEPVARSTHTDPEGAFELNLLPPASYALRVSAPGFVTKRVRIDANSERVESVQMERGATIDVRVWHRIANLPIRGATVRLYAGGVLVVEAATDAHGELQLLDLASGDYALAVYRGELPLASRTVSLSAGGRALERLLLTDGVELRVDVAKLVSAERPTGRREAWLSPVLETPGIPLTTISADPEADGEFRFVGLPAGRYWLEVSDQFGKGEIPDRNLAARVVEISGAQALTEVSLDAREQEVAVVQLQFTGRSNSRPTVRAIRVDNERCCCYLRDAADLVELSLLRGSYRLEVSGRELAPVTIRVDDLRPGELRTLAVELAASVATQNTLAGYFANEATISTFAGLGLAGFVALIAPVCRLEFAPGEVRGLALVLDPLVAAGAEHLECYALAGRPGDLLQSIVEWRRLRTEIGGDTIRICPSD
ncbi:MAG: sigma-70 family RNA polymerase sigma factor [Planctomycetota bacterium]